MSDRILIKDLENLCSDLNELCGFGRKPVYSTLGAYNVGMAYGGYRLERYANTSGGINVISPNGYGTKKQLYKFLQGYVENERANRV